MSRGRECETIDVITQTGRIVVYFNQVLGGTNIKPFLRFAATQNTLYGVFIAVIQAGDEICKVGAFMETSPSGLQHQERV